MVFSSHLFLFYFLPLVLLLYCAAPRRGRHLVLTLCSYWFYGWANPLFVFLMLFSTLVDYVCGLFISGNWDGRHDRLLEEGGGRTSTQRVALVVSILTNLGLLGFFKYFNFGVDSLNGLGQAFGIPGLQLDLAFRITLPLGISFYTFQSMSYTIDVFRGHARPIRNFIDFACYVSMFPQLVAGPIIRFQEVSEQLRQRSHTLEKFARGSAFLAMGLAKKVLLANPCGKVADTVFDAGSVGILESWYGLFAYAFQIYFDFSAYSDMAIGLGLMLGFVFAKNFDSPYCSRSITEFWRRWHISLSSWLRDYLYIPLGGNRRGRVRTYINLALVMLLGGLWHGASWNFVIWGAIHGGMLCFERFMGRRSPYHFLPDSARVILTFLLVNLGWVFFRAADLPTAVAFCRSLVGLATPVPNEVLLGGVIYQPYYLTTFAIAALVVWTAPQTWDWTRRITPFKTVVILALFLLSLVVLSTQAFNPFIYFIF